MDAPKSRWYRNIAGGCRGERTPMTLSPQVFFRLRYVHLRNFSTPPAALLICRDVIGNCERGGRGRDGGADRLFSLSRDSAIAVR